MRLLGYGAVSLLGLLAEPHFPSMAAWVNALFIYVCLLTLSVCGVILLAGHERDVRRSDTTRRAMAFEGARKKTLAGISHRPRE